MTMQYVKIPVHLFKKIVPEEGIASDRVDCVWCHGNSTDPDWHDKECPWFRGRKILNKTLMGDF